MRFLDFWGPEGGAAGARKRSPRYQRGTIIHIANAIPPPAFRTLSHHVHCQRYPTTTLSTLSHHPHCERYRTSHTANAIPPPTLPTLSHLPHCQHCPITYIAESITPTLPNPQSHHPHCQSTKVNVKQFVYRRSTLMMSRHEK